MQILPDEWAAWKGDPVTKAVLFYLSARRTLLMEGWANGDYGSDLALSSKAMGEAQGYQLVIDLTQELVNQGNE